MNGTPFNPTDIRKKVFSGYTIDELLKEYSFVATKDELHDKLKQSYKRKPQDFRLMWDQLEKNTQGGKGAISMPKKKHRKINNSNLAKSTEVNNKEPALLVVNSTTVPALDTQPTCIAPVLSMLDKFTKSGKETERLLNEIKEDADEELADLTEQIEKIICFDDSNQEPARVADLRSQIEAATEDIVSFEKDIKSYKQQYREDCKKIESISNNLQALKAKLLEEQAELEKIFSEMPELEQKTAEAVELRKMAIAERESLEEELQKALCKRFYCGDSDPSNPEEFDYVVKDIEADADTVSHKAILMFTDLDMYGELTAVEMLELAKILTLVESAGAEDNHIIVLENTESGIKLAEVLKKLGKSVEVMEKC